MAIEKLTKIATLIIMEDAAKKLLDEGFKKEVWDKSFDHKSFLKAVDDEELFQTMCTLFFCGMFADQIIKLAATVIKDILD